MSELLHTGRTPNKKILIKPHLLLGLCFITLLMGSYYIDHDYLDGIRHLQQNNNIYKQLTGYLLLLLILWQWQLAHSRAVRNMRNFPSKVALHKWAGAIIPMCILLHSSETGYGYQTLLLFTFLGVLITGLFNYHEVRIKSSWYRPLWLTLHIGLSVSMMFILTNHIYISYVYS